jgi:hypothetical protein
MGSVTVMVIAPYVAVAVAALCVVSQALSLGCIMLWLQLPCCVWCYNRCRHAGLHAACGATGAVAASCVVPQVQSSHCMWCHRHCCCSVHGVIGALLLCHVWCHRCCCCTTCGVVGTVIGLCSHGGHAVYGVTVTIVMVCEVVVTVVVIVLHVVVVAVVHHMWCHGHDCHATWCCESVVSGLKKRELAEKEKRKLTCSHEWHGDMVHMCRDKVRGACQCLHVSSLTLWSIVGPSGPLREKVTVSIGKECSGLAANEEVSQKKKEKKRKYHTSGVAV